MGVDHPRERPEVQQLGERDGQQDERHEGSLRAIPRARTHDLLRRLKSAVHRSWQRSRRHRSRGDRPG